MAHAIEVNKGGRPLKFENAAELQIKIDDYFNFCDEKGKPYTITGLALALDTCRDTLLEYENRDKFADTIKKAKMKIHNYAEEACFFAKNPAGIIFNLKNNWGWKDKTETEVTVNTGLAERLQRAKERRNITAESIPVIDV